MTRTTKAAGTSLRRIPDQYDVIIIGSGIAGSVLGAILARHNVKVLLIDAGVHPKFAVGESTTLYTLKAFRQLGVRYNVPELEHLTSFEGTLEHIGNTFGTKKHFGFMLHHEGREPDPREVNQFSPPSRTLQTSHLYRPDSDNYLFQIALGYGCVPIQRFDVAGIDLSENHVAVTGKDGSRYTGRFLVDGSGFRSPLAQMLDLREGPDTLKHHSRSLFSQMIDVAPTDDVLGMALEDLPPIPWVQGTMHHMFERGWFWVIPFNNDPRSRNPLVSVGLTFDERMYPRDENLTPEQEFFHHASRFPVVERIFANAKTVLPWVSTGRLQFTSKQSVGHRWAMMSHASGFLDPLYSRGLTNTTEVINALVWRLLDALREDDFAVERFAYVNTLQKGLIRYNDDLVNASFIGFSDYDLWNSVYRIWCAAEVPINLRFDRFIERYRETGHDQVFKDMEDVPFPGHLMPDQSGYAALFAQMASLCEEVDRGERSTSSAAKELMGAIKASDSVLEGLSIKDEGRRFMFPGPPELKVMSQWLHEEAPASMAYLIRGVGGAGRAPAKRDGEAVDPAIPS